MFEQLLYSIDLVTSERGWGSREWAWHRVGDGLASTVEEDPACRGEMLGRSKGPFVLPAAGLPAAAASNRTKEAGMERCAARGGGFIVSERGCV